MSDDPRVRRTRRRLKQALLELIAETGYEAVTVELLTERADVARSTFYAHYSAKEDLLFDGFRAWLLSSAELAHATEAVGLRFGFSLPLLRHGARQSKFFRETILRGRSDRVRRRLREVVADVALREMESARVVESPTPEGTGRARAVAGAFLALVEWWMEEARTLTAEEVDGIFQDAVAGQG